MKLSPDRVDASTSAASFCRECMKCVKECPLNALKMEKMIEVVFEDLSRKGFGLFELARKMDQRPNTLHNLLKTIISCGYVEQNSESRDMAGRNVGKSVCSTPMFQRN